MSINWFDLLMVFIGIVIIVNIAANVSRIVLEMKYLRQLERGSSKEYLELTNGGKEGWLAKGYFSIIDYGFYRRLASFMISNPSNGGFSNRQIGKYRTLNYMYMITLTIVIALFGIAFLFLMYLLTIGK